MGKKRQASEMVAAAGPAGVPQPSSVAAPGQQGSGSDFKNKEKVLILSTRGITFRYRHLMTDITALIPHSKKDSKLDTKNDRNILNEVADMKSCSSVLFFEVRKKQDLYLWMAKTPDGPSAKFHVANVHTMAEMKLTGNHLKGSRPVLSFHKVFDEQPHLQLLKEMFTHVFATPKRHHKSKPFFDHVLSFTVADGRVWFRNYQVVVPLDKKKVDPESVTLVEVGPRFCLNPVRIFDKSFGGRTLYENPNYVSPNAVRSSAKRQQAGKYVGKVNSHQARKDHKLQNPMPRGEMDDLFQEEPEDDEFDD
mmetsp:Transcript_5631/g.9803  ORF Transcript_5631/g.9803 Transcript_5631/m.9803 type:complete len:307 (-) Transcript_5631:491-1411(-)|eukprot:CAMPEP_0119109194 /NCGR_PEP_ID=MMETSP1180-20130426/17646_1 /TAXON_ID=3052 ORGANISM="Chlamydomonas cf sp, Strain CCMP681" /NCGR_SAMPLE_ID=MMETSP1180 /ASSEMBLY_ACC=CAM_ASM_000741 /LENGTH=306 /DNA_ID=CAMNT_0007094921 /DNA_START=115 /DNA_END=1035 /DNA_ORIENTATION=-